MSFIVQDVNHGSIQVLSIPERLTTETSDELKKILKDLVEKGKYKLVMDLKDTQYMDSSGLGAIVSKIAVMRSNNGDIRIAAPQEYVMNLLELTHIDQIVKIFKNVDEAVNSFKE